LFWQNAASGSKYNSASNAFWLLQLPPAVPPGTYTLTIQAAGLRPGWAKDITEHQGESHNIPHIILPMSLAETGSRSRHRKQAWIPLDKFQHDYSEHADGRLPFIVGRDAAEW